MVATIARRHHYIGFSESSKPWPRCGYPMCKAKAFREIYWEMDVDDKGRALRRVAGSVPGLGPFQRDRKER